MTGKTKTLLGKTESNFLLSCDKVKTNIFAVLHALKAIAEEIRQLQTTYAALPLWQERFEILEKNLPKEFELRNISIFVDNELMNFKTFFGDKTQYDDSKWMPAVLSEEVLDRQIGIVLEMMKPKVIKVA